MITSPSPIQQPQPPEEKAPEQKKELYKSRTLAGQTPMARFFKAILRPIFKGLYYLFRAMGSHKLVTLFMLVLIVGSATVANYVTTKQWPFGIGDDQFNFHVHGGNGGGDLVQNWLFHLRDGNLAAMEIDDRNMPSPPAPADLQQFINQFSQTKGHLSWKAINVIGISQETDTTVDSLVEVDLSASGPGGPVGGYMIWHFVTVSGQQGEVLFSVGIVDFRPALQ